MKTFLEFLKEAKQPHSFVIKMSYDRMPHYHFRQELKDWAEFKFSKGTDVSVDISSVSADRSGNYKYQYTIVPADSKDLTRQNISDISAFFNKALGYNFSDKSLKVTITKTDSSLEGVTPGSNIEKVYKTLFGKTAPKLGQKITTNLGTGKQVFSVVHIVSNHIIVLDSYALQGTYQYGGVRWIFVKDRGAWTESTAPQEFKKHL